MYISELGFSVKAILNSYFIVALCSLACPLIKGRNDYMNKRIAFILTATVLTTMLSGCGSTVPASTQSTTATSQSETAQPNSSDDAQDSATDASDIAEAEKNIIDFESDYGYTISYEEDNFDYRRTEGYDEFVFKSDAVDKPFVFVCVSRVGAEFVEQVKLSALGENPESCTIGQAQTQGQCSEIEEEWDGGKVIHKTYVCPFDSGDILLIEMQWYTEQTDDPYAALLWEMVNSIKI